MDKNLCIKRIVEIEAEMNCLMDKVKHLPQGYISCQRNGPRVKWYHVNDGPRRYLPKSQGELARQLADKRYYQARLADLANERDALNAYLSHVKDYKSKEIQLISNSFYRELISDCHNVSDKVSAWLHEDYKKSNEYPENLTLHCVSGNIVRSKSEMLIDQVLFTHHLPFRYECALMLGNMEIYPDFTIMHPRTGKILYHEHFGMMDNPSYASKAMSKIARYNSFGIIPGIDLIMTFESESHPLDMQAVECMVNLYFS